MNIAILEYDFMIRALVAGVVIAAIAPAIGTFLVVRRHAYMADTLAHIALVGVALGAIMNIAPLPAAIVVTALAALAIDYIEAHEESFGEATLALFLSGSLAIAVILFSIRGGLSTNVLGLLFGSITTVSVADVWTIVGVGIAVAITMAFLTGRLFLITLHSELAQAEGLRVRRYTVALMLVAAVTIALAMRVVGVLLVGALMVVPVVTAMLVKRGFRVTMTIAIVLSLAATFIGLILSFYLDLPSGGAIVVTALLFFIVTFIRTRWRYCP